MEDLGAIAMVTALMWPMVGGAVTGLIGGVVKRFGLVGTLITAIVGSALGYGFILALIRLSDNATLPDAVGLALTVGLPILAGLIAICLVGRFRST